MGRGENDQDKKAKAHPYRRPEQKTKRSDHKNPSNDIVGSIITGHGWEERFTWDMEKPYYYNTIHREHLVSTGLFPI